MGRGRKAKKTVENAPEKSEALQEQTSQTEGMQSAVEPKTELTETPPQTDTTQADIEFIKNLGYDTTYLENISDKEKLRSEIAHAKDTIPKIEDIKKQLGKYEISELEHKVREIKDKLRDIRALDEIVKSFEELKKDWAEIKSLKLKEELANIEIPGFEEDILKIWKMFGTESVEKIEKEVAALKQRVKERFFEMQIVSSIVTTPSKGGPQKTIKARAEEVFLTDGNGKILIRYTRKWRVDNKNALTKLLSEAYKIQKNLSTAYAFETRKFDSNIYEIGLIRGTKFYLGIVATKELHAMTKQFLDKTLRLVEERFSPDNLTVPGITMVLKALLNVYNKVSQNTEDLNAEFEVVTELH